MTRWAPSLKQSLAMNLPLLRGRNIFLILELQVVSISSANTLIIWDMECYQWLLIWIP
jgi:hypothetical protein